MKRPTAASRKKVTPENLARLGPERLAEILAGVAATRPELKRRLRMELAAEEGPEHLLAEIDKRLASFQSSRSKVSWRQRPTFVREIDGLRGLIVERLARQDPAAALDRLWQFLEIARRVGARMRDRDGALAAVFDRAADGLGGLLAGEEPHLAAERLVDAAVRNLPGWTGWLPRVLAPAPPALAEAALVRIAARPEPQAAWMPLVRRLADAAGNAEAYRATFTPEALKTPSIAAEVAQRLLAAGRIEEAGSVLRQAAPAPDPGLPGRKGRAVEPDEHWESVWIDYLERAGDAAAAQAARWASFERTLSVDRARAFTSRLGDFDDVEAEARAFEHAAGHPDFRRGLAFLMAWPALPEAARMVEARPDDIDVSPEEAELWAARLRSRRPAAAHLLLRKAAAAAFRRRDMATCDRLTHEADSIAL